MRGARAGGLLEEHAVLDDHADFAQARGARWCRSAPASRWMNSWVTFVVHDAGVLHDIREALLRRGEKPEACPLPC